MANLRPDELSGVSSLDNDDILIAEINPESAESRKVVKISQEIFFLALAEMILLLLILEAESIWSVGLLVAI